MTKLPHNLLHELLDAIHWNAFSKDDTTLEIDRTVAEKIRLKVNDACDTNTSSL